MEPLTLWSSILTAAMAGFGWFAKTIYTAIQSIQDDLASHKVEVAKTYATNSDMCRIEDKLDKILDKLERKADR